MDNKQLSYNILDNTVNINIDYNFNNAAPLYNAENAKLLHFHAEFEIFFINNGILKIETKNKTHVFENSIVIVPPFFPHYSMLPQHNYRFTFILTHTTEDNKLKFFKANPDFLYDNLTIKKLNQEHIFYLKEIANVCNSYSNQDKLNYLFPLLMMSILNFPSNNKYTPSIENYASKIERIIGQYFISNNITITFLANKLYLSTKQTARIIKAIYNTSLSSLIINKKLYIAEMLLIKTKMQISEIISYANFNTENYFYTEFKKKYKCTPLQYRKKHSTIPDNIT